MKRWLPHEFAEHVAKSCTNWPHSPNISHFIAKIRQCRPTLAEVGPEPANNADIKRFRVRRASTPTESVTPENVCVCVAPGSEHSNPAPPETKA